MTSNDLKCPQLTSKDSSSILETVEPMKNKLKGGGNFEINHDYIDESLQKNNF